MSDALASDEQLAWERTCPAAITSDVIWNLHAYRAALFLQHVSRGDGRAMLAMRADDARVNQLTRAASSVGANLGEGYSRSSRADRIRFLGYSLGSTRECITWYHASSDVLPGYVLEQRLILLVRIRSLLLGLIKSMRSKATTATPFER